MTVVQQRDRLKQKFCVDHGITLITIPFWWNKTIGSIAHRLCIARPDIMLHSELLKDATPLLDHRPDQPVSSFDYYATKALPFDAFTCI